uniref:DENN domain containing 6A n=1 Tax=Rousettus aegyptiacus TaxID=9407 RepID=A0A7J8HPN3_ROUAE|nr:DENN domain containing 6A [Rousettus aegyptiacus]
MALRGLAHSGPSSRGPSEEAVAAAEERRAPVVVAAGAVREDDEEDDGRGRGLLRWDGFSAWLHCVCVVGFDLELGQAVEVIYPQHSKLTDKEKTNICYLSFPDSNSGCLGDTQFCFRFRQSSGRRVSLHCLLDQFDKDLPVYLKVGKVVIEEYPWRRNFRIQLITQLPLIAFRTVAVVLFLYYSTGFPESDS